MADLTAKYGKALDLIQNLVATLYRTERSEQGYRFALESLRDDLDLFLPHFEDYRKNPELRLALGKYFTVEINEMSKERLFEVQRRA